MKKKWKIIIAVLVLIILGVVWFLFTPTDIRPSYIKGKIAEEDFIKGKNLLSEMQDAYGGMDNWLAFKTGNYGQTADWYEDRFGVANWDTLPQQFQMTSTLGTDDSEFILLNGKNTGQVWGVKDWKSYQKKEDRQVEWIHNQKYYHKIIYKNYWFQFPFRISEAPIIAYAGEGTVKGKTYDLLYATWQSETPNRKYDQYILYLDKKTRMVEWLNFTVRSKVNFFKGTVQFTDFKNVNGIMLPFSQYVTYGKPASDGMKLHENRYDWIEFGGTRVNR